MVNVTAARSLAHQYTEYFVSCAACEWHPSSPFLTVTDVAMRNSDYLPAYIKGRIDQMKASHRCQEQG